MRKFIIVILALTCGLALIGCNSRNVNEVAGTITFYSEPVSETSKTVTVRASIELNDKQAEKINKILNEVDEWVDDNAVNRSPYYFDGEFQLSDNENIYLFTDEYNVIYYDHYFAQIAEDDMQFIMNIK